MRILYITLSFTLLCFCLLNPLHHTALAAKITLGQGQIATIPIAITHFESDATIKGETFSDIIRYDLEGSGIFSTIDPKAFLSHSSTVDSRPNFAPWRRLNAQALLLGSIKTLPGGKLNVSYRLWDVLAGKEYTSEQFTGNAQDWRRFAHKVADGIYSRLTGEGPYFDSRILYVAVDGHYKNPRKRLAIMAQDGAQHAYLTDGKSLILSPRFDHNSQRIIYMSYHRKKPSVYLFDLQTGHQELLGQFDGISYAPRFSPDGTQAILSVAKGGVSHIYTIDLQSKKTTRITSGRAIDTSPSFSADGRKIVFNSDRAGRQQLYVMDSNGSNITKISQGNGSYATPVWSPKGDLIAFTKMYKGKFHIGVMRPDGSAERLLTTSFLDEGPTWSPNGRVLMFSRQARGKADDAGKSQLYTVDVLTGKTRQIQTLTKAHDPAWSPLLR